MTPDTRLLSPSRISAALRFWEPMRLVYNLALIAAFFALGGGTLLAEGSVVGTAGIIVLAAFANLLYCLAYPIDLVLQHSDWSEAWRRRGRLALFTSGLLIALALEYLTLFGMTMRPMGGFGA
jgi:hypothetical protein